jgi:AcrR family transcriptional regulator
MSTSGEPMTLSQRAIPAEPATPARPGLRERKKAKTRAAIRDQALRLIGEQGYDATTVEQIAEAAEVSPSTFFRYFPSKEQVAMADDLDPLMIEAIRAQPADLSPLRAFVRATMEVFDSLSPEEMEFEQQRMQLIASVPELSSVIAQETDRNIRLLSTLAAERAGRGEDELEVRAFAGALIGAMMTAFDPRPGGGLDLDKIGRIADFLEAGMPL